VFTRGRPFVCAFVITFRVRRSRRELATAVRVPVCMSVPRRIPTLLHGPVCKLGE